MTRRRVLEEVNKSINFIGTFSSDINVGDVVFYDRLNNRFVAVKLDSNGTNITSTKYTFSSNDYIPVALVVDKINGVWTCVALRYASDTNPDFGDLKEVPLLYGGDEIFTMDCEKYEYVPAYGKETQTLEVSGQATSACLPRYNGNIYYEECKHANLSVSYFYTHYYYGPSVYIKYWENELNPIYFTKSSEVFESNALSDFNGIENTKKLLEFATKQPNWKTDKTITVKNQNGYSAAACCTWRFHTEGTNQGDWYIPSLGELGYLWFWWYTLDQKRTILNSYDNLCCDYLNDYTWGSSTFANKYIWGNSVTLRSDRQDTYNQIIYNGAHYYQRILPFIQLNLTPIKNQSDID